MSVKCPDCRIQIKKQNFDLKKGKGYCHKCEYVYKFKNVKLADFPPPPLKKKPKETPLELIRDGDEKITISVPMEPYGAGGSATYGEILLGLLVMGMPLFYYLFYDFGYEEYPGDFKLGIALGFVVIMALLGAGLIFHAVWCLIGKTFVTITRNKVITGKKILFLKFTKNCKPDEIEDIRPIVTKKYAEWMMSLLAVGIFFKTKRKPFLILGWNGLSEKGCDWAVGELYHFWQ